MFLLILIMKTLASQENSGPETLIYYNNVLSTFRIYITLISFP